MRHFSGVFDIPSLKNLGIFEKLKNVKEKLLNYVYIYRTVMNIVSGELSETEKNMIYFRLLENYLSIH